METNDKITKVGLFGRMPLFMVCVWITAFLLWESYESQTTFPKETDSCFLVALVWLISVKDTHSDVHVLFIWLFCFYSRCCQCPPTWTTQLLSGGKQKRFVFVGPLTNGYCLCWEASVLSAERFLKTCKQCICCMTEVRCKDLSKPFGIKKKDRKSESAESTVGKGARDNS